MAQFTISLSYETWDPVLKGGDVNIIFNPF
jgi:hypothetical protein